MPEVSHDELTTEVVFDTMNNLFKDILPVKRWVRPISGLLPGII